MDDAIKVREFCRDDQIFSAIDDLTKYGIGLCGPVQYLMVAGSVWMGRFLQLLVVYKR